MLELEGTWEEILAQAPLLAGRRVRVTVLDAVEDGTKESELSPVERFAAAIRAIEESDKDMPFTPGGNTQAYLREARAGAMYGDEPTE
jgi:hypothetical protein